LAGLFGGERGRQSGIGNNQDRQYLNLGNIIPVFPPSVEAQNLGSDGFATASNRIEAAFVAGVADYRCRRAEIC